MKDPKCELTKVRRVISWSGAFHEFSREKLNVYKELEDNPEIVCRIKGLFHESSSYTSLKSGEATQLRSKPQPMILTVYEESKVLMLNDSVTIGNCLYRVTDVKDIMNLGIIGDVSLEVVV